MTRATALRLIGAAIAFLPAAALAGGTAVTESSSAGMNIGSSSMAGGTTRTEIAWRDPGTVRITPKGQGGYMIARDGSVYSVAQQGGQTMVIDMAAMKGMMQQMTQGQSGNGPSLGSVDSVQATGRSETVAGIRGKVFNVTTTDFRDTTVTSEWVLTGDPLVTEMTDAYFGAITSMFGNDGGQMARNWQGGLPAGMHGILRAGDQFRLVSISADTPPANQFELPAAPTDLGAMMKGMGN